MPFSDNETNLFEINSHYQDSSKAKTFLSLRKVKFVSNSVYYIISKSFNKAMKHFRGENFSQREFSG